MQHWSATHISTPAWVFHSVPVDSALSLSLNDLPERWRMYSSSVSRSSSLLCHLKMEGIKVTPGGKHTLRPGQNMYFELKNVRCAWFILQAGLALLSQIFHWSFCTWEVKSSTPQVHIFTYISHFTYLFCPGVHQLKQYIEGAVAILVDVQSLLLKSWSYLVQF